MSAAAQRRRCRVSGPSPACRHRWPVSRRLLAGGVQSWSRVCEELVARSLRSRWGGPGQIKRRFQTDGTRCSSFSSYLRTSGVLAAVVRINPFYTDRSTQAPLMGSVPPSDLACDPVTGDLTPGWTPLWCMKLNLAAAGGAQTAAPEIFTSSRRNRKHFILTL